MKRIFFFATISLSILSWIFFLCLSILLFFPASSIKIVDQYAITSYSIDFSDLENSGNVINQNLKFFDLHIKYNEKSVLKLRELELGISFIPQNFFKPLSLRIINIKDGYYKHIYLSESNSSFVNFVAFDDESSLSFQNFEYKKDDSAIVINGDLFGKFPNSFNGQLSFLHDNNLSTLAVNLTESAYRFSINLHSYEWLSLIPPYNGSPFKKFEFKLNAVGEVQDNQSFIKGSLDYGQLYFQPLNIKPNKGSFVFQSSQGIGSLTLTKFLHPFVDEAHPIHINLNKKSIVFPRFFLTPQMLDTDVLKFSNFTVENLFLSFKNKIPKYSGFVGDLDLKGLYFEEILNLRGEFSGRGKNFKLTINSDSSILKNYKKNFIPVSIVAGGNLYNSNLNLAGRIKNQSSDIDFNLKLNSDLNESSSITFKGKDVMKDLITFSLPFSLREYSSFVDKNFNFGSQNLFYFNYLIPNKNFPGALKAKILMNESKLNIYEDSSINLISSIIEFDEKDLYFFSPSGNAFNFSYDTAFGLLNFQSQKLRFYSIHDLKSSELKKATGLQNESFNLPSMFAEQKGELNLSNLKLKNVISAKTKKFDLPIYDSHKINFDEASIFIVDLDKIFGLFPSNFMKQEALVHLSGADLTSQYNLTFSTTINLDLDKYVPDSTFLKVNGNDDFELELSINKNSSPSLNIYSDLNNTELISPINSLAKNKSRILPTEIHINNFLNPSLKITNQVIEAHIRDFKEYLGYISIGKKLPHEFIGFKKEPGLNLYLYLDYMNENLLDRVFPGNSNSTPIQLNKLAFNVKNFQFYDNNFSNFAGKFNFSTSDVIGNLVADKLNLSFKMDKTGFVKVEINDSSIPDLSFINFSQSNSDLTIKSRVIIKNSDFGEIKIKDFDAYVLNNNKNFAVNNLKLDADLISIKPFQNSSNAYFSINKIQPLNKVRGDFLIKDSKKIPYLSDLADFSYFNGSVNLQWTELSSLSNIEGESNFILKDLLIKDSFSDSRAINLLGVLNLKNILGKLANLDLSIDEFTSTKLGRVEGDLLFSKSKMRLIAPLFIETNAAKMKWVGQINKNKQNNLHDLDLNLDLRVRLGENLPWYAAILGGLPAVAGSAVINEMFAEDINDLTNFQYEVLGTISEPNLKRVR